MTTEILSPESVIIGGRARTRDEAIREAGELLIAAGAVTHDYIDAMRQREETVSTFMGNGLAIPHGTNEAKDAIRRSALCVIRYDEPLDWDGESVRFVVGIAGRDGEHLEILSAIAIIFSEEDTVAELLAAPDAAALHALLAEVNA